MQYEKFEYFNYEAYKFEFDGLKAIVVKPNVKPNGKWVYKTEYFTAFPDTQNEFLDRGYHLCYNENFTRWAPDSDLERKGRFIKFISKEFGLSEKCIPIGMSCGGMYAVKTAAKFPELIEAMYIDAPVMNLLSCPCDLGVAKSGFINEFLKAVNKTMAEVISYRMHPIDVMHVLVEKDIPIVMVAGDSDTVVPYEENGALLEKLYTEKGGRLIVHIKKGADHHPHGLDDPNIIVNEIESFIK
ncbi:MAG: alpha/beta hydrolase [Clostridia bacterium]|nr:alpha/beta hydrolase [Clostridia bacterium]